MKGKEREKVKTGIKKGQESTVKEWNEKGAGQEKEEEGGNT